MHAMDLAGLLTKKIEGAVSGAAPSLLF